MKRHDMAGFVPSKKRVTTTADSTHRRPDLLGGDFGAARPDAAWVGDISYIRTRQGFLYLAFVLDLASRRVVGISMAPHLKATLATDAPRSEPPEEAKCTVWCSTPTAARSTRRGHRPAVSGLRHPPISRPDRGVLGQRRCRVVPRNPQEGTRQPHRAPGLSRWWIEAWYNPRRLHSTIGQQPPNEWEDNYYRPHKPSVQHTGGTPRTPPHFWWIPTSPGRSRTPHSLPKSPESRIETAIFDRIGPAPDTLHGNGASRRENPEERHGLLL